jgi:hypothetical protein
MRQKDVVRFILLTLHVRGGVWESFHPREGATCLRRKFEGKELIYTFTGNVSIFTVQVVGGV